MFPRGERRQLTTVDLQLSYFNPLSRKENDFRNRQGGRKQPISIHVPARGTTPEVKDAVCAAAISIHVPARGTTTRPLKRYRKYTHFNPRSREGNDWIIACLQRVRVLFQSTFPRGERPLAGNIYAVNVPISIHVPARGTTIFTVQITIVNINFNPRSREGNDSPATLFFSTITDFNPRSREGNDNTRRLKMNSSGNFNPRSREGNDHRSMMMSKLFRKFQSTFPRGERPDRLKVSTAIVRFQSTFPRGERL